MDPDHPFENVQSDSYYWLATNDMSPTIDARFVFFGDFCASDSS